MKSDRTQRRPNIILCVVAALLAIGPASIVRGADRDYTRLGGASDAAAQQLQLGVGQSIIFDLPEEAGEIYVGDPNVANAIVRSAKRVYISGVANGQTSIFALARDGRRIAVLQVSVGRAVAELSNLLNTAIPGNANSCAHGREHDHPHRVRRVGRRGSKGDRYRLTALSMIRRPRPPGAAISISTTAASRRRRFWPVQRHDPLSRPEHRVINALTIRGADQVSLHVTVAEIRREIIKQLGVNFSGSGPNGSFNTRQSVRRSTAPSPPPKEF